MINSRTMNIAIIGGYLGADPKISETPSGTSVCTLSVATNTPKRVGDEWENQTMWHRIVLFGRTAEVASEYCKKGTYVQCQGQIHYNQWTDREGQKRYGTEIRVGGANSFSFQNKREGEDDTQYQDDDIPLDND